MEILFAAALLVVALAVVVNRLRPTQRLAVLVGVAAAAVQVFYPPCVGIDGIVTRQWMSGTLTYHPNDAGMWIAGGRQAAWLAATAVAVVVACGVLEWRHRSRPGDTP